MTAPNSRTEDPRTAGSAASDQAVLPALDSRPAAVKGKPVAGLVPFVYRAEILGVLDGDNVLVDLDLGRGLHDRGQNGEGLSLRLHGGNARELNEPGGPEAAVSLGDRLPVGLRCTIATIKPDKYGGRFQARIVLDDGTDLVPERIAQQWLAPWNGRGPRPLPPWPRTVP